MYKRIVNTNIKGRIRQHYYCEFNNAVYEGDALHYKKDGVGMLIADEGSVYFGGFSQDNFHGEGVVMFSSGGMMYALFEKGRPNGFYVATLHGQTSCGYIALGVLNGRNYTYCPLKKTWTFSEFSNGLKVRDISEEISASEQTQSSFLQRDTFLSEKYSNFLELRIEGIFKKNLNNSLSLLECNENPQLKCIGFIDTSTKQLNGLGCVISKTSVQVNNYNMSGRYQNGGLTGLGRISHSNGDVYDGFLRNDQMEGQGIYYTKQTNQFIYAEFKNNQCGNILYEGLEYPSQVSKKMKNKVHQKSIHYMDKKADFSIIGVSLPALFKQVSDLPSVGSNSNQQQLRKGGDSRSKLRSPTQSQYVNDGLILTPSDFEKIEKSGKKIQSQEKNKNEFIRQTEPAPVFSSFSPEKSFRLSVQQLEKTPPRENRSRGVTDFSDTIQSEFQQSPEKYRQQSVKRSIFQQQPVVSSLRSTESPRIQRPNSSVRFSNDTSFDKRTDLSSPFKQAQPERQRSVTPNTLSPSQLRVPTSLSQSRDSGVLHSQSKRYQPIFQKDQNRMALSRSIQQNPVLSRSRNASQIKLSLPHELSNQPIINKIQQLTSDYPTTATTSILRPPLQEHSFPNLTVSREEPNTQQTDLSQSQINKSSRIYINNQQFYSPEFNPSNYSLKDIMRTLNPSAADKPAQQENVLGTSQSTSILRSQRPNDMMSFRMNN